MWNAVAFALIILIAVIMIVLAVYLGERIGYMRRNAELAEEQRRHAADSLQQAQQELFELQHALETERAEWQRRQQKPTYSSGWDPSNPLSGGERQYT